LLYQIEQSLQVEQEERWNLRQHYRHIQVGDQVLIWISGKRAGIYAVGKVLTDPVIEPDSLKGIDYWIDKRQGQRAISRVIVKYDRVLLDRPLLRDFLLCDPDLWALSILRNPRGTNFAVTESEWQALKTWLGL
jgi:predicted RNA-binding protein with PUA-like domain